MKKCGELYDEKATSEQSRVEQLESAKGTMKVEIIENNIKTYVNELCKLSDVDCSDVMMINISYTCFVCS